MHIYRTKEHLKRPDLEWDNEERTQLERDILSLSDSQIGALVHILIGISEKDIPDVVRDIKQNGTESGHLPILLEETESKEKIRWWAHYFKQGTL